MPDPRQSPTGILHAACRIFLVVAAAALVLDSSRATAEDQAVGAGANSTAARLGESPGNGYAKVKVFGVEGTGNKFVYVFDRSASMEGAPLANAKRQLIESLKSLDELHQFHIIFFNHRLQAFNSSPGGRRIAFADDRNKLLAAGFVRRIKADGGTDRFAALKHALALNPDTIFFLSDADDPMSDREMATLAELNEGVGAAICVIEFGNGAVEPERNFLTELARQSGGQYGYVDVAKLKP
jgi:von Willebrand factor type A domain